ncbi:hypothetical protein FBU31_001400 [Coemansia sp. 'formosensis']|nr:hypothetical protein FBU31_001400 [Coemansia sp. 'formosensis']
MSQSSITVVPLSKVDGYAVWSALVYLVLDENHLLDVVEKGTWVSTSKDTADDDKSSVGLEEQRRSPRNNRLAHAMIIAHLDPALQKKYVVIEDARELWARLEFNFTRPNNTRS